MKIAEKIKQAAEKKRLRELSMMPE